MAHADGGSDPEVGLARWEASDQGGGPQDAELVPLWAGRYDPAHIALADAGVPST